MLVIAVLILALLSVFLIVAALFVACLYFQLLFATCILFFLSIHFTYPKNKIKFPLELEGYAAFVVAALFLQKDDNMSLWGAIIQETRYYLHSIPQTTIKHTRRGSNKVAHRLTQLGFTLDQR